jgi:hypothetical protein
VSSILDKPVSERGQDALHQERRVARGRVAGIERWQRRVEHEQDMVAVLGGYAAFDFADLAGASLRKRQAA